MFCFLVYIAIQNSFALSRVLSTVNSMSSCDKSREGSREGDQRQRFRRIDAGDGAGVIILRVFDVGEYILDVVSGMWSGCVVVECVLFWWALRVPVKWGWVQGDQR